MKKIVAFSPADQNNLPHFEKLEKSLRKFHSEEELPLLRFDNPDKNEPNFWYRATPIIAKDLLAEYETVVKFDADQIVLGPLNEIWEGKFDVATVLNDPTYPISVWDIEPYFNNGLVVMKNRDFVDHWYRLCFTKHFAKYQFREQDLLNILCSDYFDYEVKCLDLGDKFYGEFAKSAWPQFHMEDGRVMAEGKQLMVVHFGGGNDPNKGNFKIRFQPDVCAYIDGLLK